MGTIVGLTFDSTRNRLVLSTTGGDSANGFLFFNADAGTWQRSAIGSSMSNFKSITYSAASDAYFAVEHGINNSLLLDRFDAATLTRAQLQLSQYIDCGIDRCELSASGDRLVLQGKVVRLARQVAYCEARVTDAKGNLVSRATGTFLLHREI